ncbi:MAG: DUF4258 domain-containing protein [Pseudomonadota bacterium]
MSYTLHARSRILERGMIISDVLHVLRTGFVHENAVPASRPGYHRYVVQGVAPNGGQRKIGVPVIPDQAGCLLKVVTVMWIDETETRAGTIIGND